MVSNHGLKNNERSRNVYENKETVESDSNGVRPGRDCLRQNYTARATLNPNGVARRTRGATLKTRYQQ